MTTDRISEITTNLAVINFVVHQLMVTHCEREQDPVAFAQKLLAQIEETFAAASHDEQWRTEMQEQMKAFFWSGGFNPEIENITPRRLT